MHSPHGPNVALVSLLLLCAGACARVDGPEPGVDPGAAPEAQAAPHAPEAAAVGRHGPTEPAPQDAGDPDGDPDDGAGPDMPFAPVKAKLSLEQTLGGRGAPSFAANAAPVRWAADGRHLERYVGRRREWIDPRTGQSSPPAAPVETGLDRGELVASFEKVSGLPGRAAQRALAPPSLQVSRDGAVRLTATDDRVFVHGPAAKDQPAGWRVLNVGAGALELARLAPDGGAATVRAGKLLHLVDLPSGASRVLGEDGSEDVLYGRLDWVYQEEVYGRGRWNAQWWSPDSAHVAYLRIDQAAVPRYPLVDQTDGHPTARETRYPKAGDPNPTARLYVAGRDGAAAPVAADLSGYDADVLVVDVTWSPDGLLTCQLQDRVQTWLDLCVVDPATGKLTRLLRETSPTWVNLIEPPRWLPDGTFLWQSERTGQQHVYRYKADGSLVGAVTAGDWSVRRVIDVKGDTLWFSATKDGTTERHAYRVGLDGKGLTAVTPEPGTHTVQLDGAGELLIDTFTSHSTPSEVRVIDRDGKVLQVIETARVRALARFAYAAPEPLKIRARDGFELDALLFRPQDFDASHSYPVLVSTYSGPNAPSVADRWDADAWTQFLVGQGVLVLRVNVRTAAGKGQAVTGLCHKRLGASELSDIEDAVDSVTKNPWADAARVGITGWSYGGFMTAYALTHSDRFALGIAGAGVYDWRNYDTIYTERYMDTPDANPRGYALSSCVAAAGKLHGHLLMVHGTQDDNVHLQNAMQFVYALQKAGKQFDFMLYPKSGHGLGSAEQRKHLRELEWRTIERVLLGR